MGKNVQIAGRNIIRFAAGLLFVGCMPAVTLSAEPAAQNVDQSMSFKIAPQSLDSALVLFSQQSGVQLVVTADTVRGKSTQGLQGKFDPTTALTKLLEGSGLKYSIVNPRSFAIRATDRHDSKSGAADIDFTSFAANETAGILMAEAMVGAGGGADDKIKGSRRSGDDVEEMIVKEERIKPFRDTNADVPRTMNDVQPYYIFDSETIERSAALNVEDFLKQRLTMNATAQTASQITASGYAGNSSSINLRGLGADKTLVLVNGRRVASPSVGNVGLVNLNGQADLNGIPLGAIDRIEVLPSSASSIYGGSAMGGVINVVLKRNYTGGEVRATFDNTWDTYAPSRTVGASYGASLGKTQLTFNAQWGDAEALLTQDRRVLLDRGIATIRKNSPSFLYSGTNPFLGALPNITSTGEFVNGVSVPDPGTLTLKNGQQLGSRFTHISAGTAPGISTAALYSMLYTNRDVWNFELPRALQSPTGLLRPFTVTPRTGSFMLSLRRELWQGLDLDIGLSHATNNSASVYNNINSLTIPSANPNNPFTSAIVIMHPSAFEQPRNTSIQSDGVSLNFSAKLPNDWVSQLDYTWSRSDADKEYFPNAQLYGFINQGIASGTLNPFVDLMAYPLNINPAWTARYYQDGAATVAGSLALRGSGPLFDLPSGSPNLTVGLEHRTTRAPETSFVSTEPSFIGDFYFAREQASSSLYAELLVPLVKSGERPLLHALELQLAGRKERYISDAGSYGYTLLSTGGIRINGPTLNGALFTAKSTYATGNSTIGLKYMPVTDLTIRLSTGTAFLPPTDNQLIKNPLIDQFPSTILDPRNNNAQFQVNTISGGNPDLIPQNSKSINAGVIWQPERGLLKGVRLNAEYYRIDQFDAIGSLSAQAIINEESFFSDRVIRNSAGTVTFVDVSLLNLYRRETEGWDLSAAYRLKTGLGIFDMHAIGSIILDLENQYSRILPFYDSVGFPSEGGAAKYKSNLQINWNYKNWMAGWSAIYYGSYKQNGALGGPSATQRRATNPNAALSTTYTVAQGADSIPSQMYHDLYLGYAFDQGAYRNSTVGGWMGGLLSGVTLQMGVKNVFNTLPPFDVFYTYYISPYGNTRLRSYWLGAKKAF